jgi:hypothetical protein
VYNYAGGMGGLYGIGYDATQFLDASSLVSNLAGFDPHYYGDWNVDASGRITGLNAFQLAKKVMARVYPGYSSKVLEKLIKAYFMM